MASDQMYLSGICTGEHPADGLDTEVGGRRPCPRGFSQWPKREK